MCDVVRNICVLAHVDHGKTTLADFLIASNGWIRQKEAGVAKFLDSREDEQKRLITMKASNISLQYETNNERYTINLIDTPGHVDFSSEVSAAVRLCDGALVVVDVVEGFLPRTRSVLLQAWRQRTKCVLVLNKIDRLYTDLKMSSYDAFHHLSKIIENVNLCYQQLLIEEVMRLQSDATTFAIDDDVEESVRFHPSKGNVIFASSLHGWGFTIVEFIPKISKSLNIPENELRERIWSEDAYDPKTKTFHHSSKKCVADTFVLSQLWSIMKNAENQDYQPLASLMDKLELEAPCSADTILMHWLPLADRVMATVVECLPSPREAAPTRIPHIMAEGESIRELIEARTDGICILYLAKFCGMDTKQLRLTGDVLLNHEAIEEFVGFCRVYSGTLTPGMSMHVGGCSEILKVKAVYHVMGQDLLVTPQACVGSIVCVAFEANDLANLGSMVTAWLGGLHKREALEGASVLDRSLTLMSEEANVLFESPYATSASTVKVSVEPVKMKDTEAFLKGLFFLYKADPSIEIEISERGEYILGCEGEVHLEKCIADLENVFARVPFSVSDQMPSIRETLVPVDVPYVNPDILFPPWSGDHEAPDGTTSDGRASIQIRGESMPESLLGWLDQHQDRITHALEHVKRGRSEEHLKLMRSEITSRWMGGASIKGNDVPLGVCYLKGACTVLMVDGACTLRSNGVKQNIERSIENIYCTINHDLDDVNHWMPFVLNGFLHASQAGPLAEEPIRGMVFVLEKLHINGASEADSGFGTLGGLIISKMREMCRATLLAPGRFRIYEAHMRLQVYCEQSVLGKVFSVVSKRRGHIIGEELIDGTSTFRLESCVPFIESAGLATELRSASSGEVSFVILGTSWMVNGMDPFPEVTWEDEETSPPLFGIASRDVLFHIRQSKGLKTGKVVASGEKQRTLTRQK